MILQRYIAKNILTSTMLVLLVLIGFTTFLEFFDELGDIGKGQYQLADATFYVSLHTPQRIYNLLPIAALLGTMLGLGNLARQSELVAMRAAGVSVIQINKAVMIVAIGLMAVTVIVGEIINPIAGQKAEEIKSLALTGTVGLHSEHGFWTRDGNYFNHIDHILPNGYFLGVTIYDFDSHGQLREATKAKKAQYKKGSWLLSDVVQSIFDAQGVQIRSITQAHWESQLNPGMVNIVNISPEFLPIWSLFKYIQYLKDNHQTSDKYELEFWVKIIMPLSSIVMVFLAVPFSFGSLRTTSIGGRIVIGSFLGLGFHLFNTSFQNVGLAFGFVPWITATTPTLLFAILGIYLIRKVH